MPDLGKIWIVVGTRPECIKLAPVSIACRQVMGPGAVSLIGTGQHRSLLQTALDDFGLRPDVNFDIMQEGQSPTQVMTAVLSSMEALAASQRPEWVVVQGDTTTACAAALAAFQMQIRVAHVEAGLRTYDLENPFPEEANRRLIAVVADLHFAPTKLAEDALRRENIPESRIHTVGNTGIDSFLMMLEREPDSEAADLLSSLTNEGREVALLTANRRESRGPGMDNLFRALAKFLVAHPAVSLVYPTHPNRLGAQAADKYLSPLGRQVKTVSPMNYRTLCHVLSRAHLIITDSGGIQEEAATFGVPTIVCRKVTERREAVEVGIAYVAGTDHEGIAAGLEWGYERGRGRVPGRAWEHRPFGDGASGPRIAQILAAASE